VTGESFSRMGRTRLSIITPLGIISIPGIKLPICYILIILLELGFLSPFQIALSNTLKKKRVRFSRSFCKSFSVCKKLKMILFLMKYSLQESLMQVQLT
jgi:hypothetical protein